MTRYHSTPYICHNIHILLPTDWLTACHLHVQVPIGPIAMAIARAIVIVSQISRRHRWIDLELASLRACRMAAWMDEWTGGWMSIVSYCPEPKLKNNFVPD